MFYLLLVLLLSAQLHAYEYISEFISDITITKDASISVSEKISVHAQGIAIKRGIVREFPTHYYDAWGNYYTVDFAIESVLLDGKSVPYRTEDASNGVRIYIGDAHTFLQPGDYTYVIVYKTNRQLGFFANHDELYWNVTGNGWRLPIKNVIAKVHVPSDVPIDQIKVAGYTGREGSRDQNYAQQLTTDGVEFFTTKPLREYEGLTIVVGWPKGFVPEPTAWQRWIWFLKDNFHIFLFVIGLLALLFFYVAMFFRLYRKRPHAPIIPLFYPPENMLPGGMRYFKKMGYDAKVLAADIVNMAVQGYLTIDYKSTGLAGSYKLKKIENKNTNTLYNSLFELFFSSKDVVDLNKKEGEFLQGIIRREEKYYHKNIVKYFNDFTEIHFVAFLIGFIFTLLIASIALYFIFFPLLGYGIIIALGFFLLKGYTFDGWKLDAEIEGFKLFLSTTETERLKIIGTPPTRTPELYEKYLPYAIALSVEQEWSKQFAPLFKKLEEQGHPYMPLWYVGYLGYGFHAPSFSSDISNNLSSVISSSTFVPGSSSGFGNDSGGGGSSGGGGGGGGGGGW